jgi:hypothetical protein
MQEVPESFLFDQCVKFYLTEKNNEDMEGFNDVWANILNDDLLNAKDINNVPLLSSFLFPPSPAATAAAFLDVFQPPSLPHEPSLQSLTSLHPAAARGEIDDDFTLIL